MKAQTPVYTREQMSSLSLARVLAARVRSSFPDQTGPVPVFPFPDMGRDDREKLADWIVRAEDTLTRP
jgi:hypothetical protein